MKKFFLLTVLVAFAVSASAIVGVQKASSVNMTANRTSAMLNEAMKAPSMLMTPYNKMAPVQRALGDPIDTLYVPPVGTYFPIPYIFSDDYYHSFYGVLVPSQVDLVWTNATAGDAVNESTTYMWYYADKNTTGENLDTSDAVDLTTNFNGSVAYVYGAPYLSVNGSNTYYQLQEGTHVHHGGSMVIDYEAEGVHSTSLCVETFTDGSTIGRHFLNAKEDLENGWNSYETWTGLIPNLGLQDECDSLAVAGIGQYIPDPGRGYTISRAQLHTYIINRAGGKITAKIIGRDASGAFDLDNPIATADYVFPTSNEFGFQTIDFQFESIDADGLVSIDPIPLTGDCLLLIDGVYDDPRISYFTPMDQRYTYPFVKAHGNAVVENGFTLLKEFKEGEQVGLTLQESNAGYFWGSGDDVSAYNLPANLMIGVDIAYPFIYNEDEELETVNIAVAGEAKSLTLQADRMFDDWTVTADQEGNVELPEWLNIEAEDVIEIEEGEEFFTGEVNLTITADALPEGMTGRQTEVYFNVPTMSYKITVIQGEGVEPQPAKVYLIGDDPLGGWNPAAPIEMTENEETEGVFTYTVNVEEAKDIYFVFTEGIGSWAEVNGHRYGPTDADQDVVVGENMTTQLSSNDQAAYRLAAVAGEYTITFNKNTMTFRVDGEVAPEPDYKLHYGVEGAEWQDATFVPGEGENEGKLVAADVEFAANTEFKVNHGAEWYGGVAEEGEEAYLIHYGWCENIPLDLTGKNFRINEAGTYTFVLTIGEESKTLTVLGLVAPGVPGDSNGDGVVDIADVNSVINQMLGKEAMIPACDMNGDGVIDIADVNAVINKMLGK